VNYLERRVIHGMLLLVAVSLLCFTFGALAPGNFFDDMKLNPQISPATVAALRSQYGVDQPLPRRYATWIKSVLRGEWGYSFAYNCPVRSLLLARAGNTLLLTTLATLLTWLIAIPLGVWFAHRRGRWDDRFGLAGTSLLLSVPELVIALSLLYWVVRMHALPVAGMVSVRFDSLGNQDKIIDLLSHLVVPVTTLALAGLPLLVRHIRASVVEVLQAPFAHAARGHGIGKGRLLFRYALPAAANPLSSLFGLSVGALLSGSLLVEVITGWPGLGPLLLEAAMARDIYVVVGAVMASTFFMIAGSILADILLVMVDPRIRLGSA
jgi:peptide/nickel transport system permease protein